MHENSGHCIEGSPPTPAPCIVSQYLTISRVPKSLIDSALNRACGGRKWNGRNSLQWSCLTSRARWILYNERYQGHSDSNIFKPYSNLIHGYSYCLEVSWMLENLETLRIFGFQLSFRHLAFQSIACSLKPGSQQQKEFLINFDQLVTVGFCWLLMVSVVLGHINSGLNLRNFLRDVQSRNNVRLLRCELIQQFQSGGP